MGYLNRVFLLGRLGQDPELRQVGDSQVCEFSVATTETWKDKKGNKQERTEWSKVVFWGNQAEVISKYFAKGSQIFVEGSLTTEKWQDKDGNDRYTTKIKGQKFLFMDSKGDSQSQPHGQQPDPDDDGIPF